MRKPDLIIGEIQDLDKIIISTNDLILEFPKDRILQLNLQQTEFRKELLLTEFEESLQHYGRHSIKYIFNDMDGFFKVHRKILDSQVFAHQTALKIWIWCLAKVTFKERFVSLKVGKGETTIKLNPGQFIFGRFKAEEELNIDGSTIYKWMQKFSTKEFDMITIKSNNQYSIITLNNWERYNIINGNEEQPCNNCVTTAEQPCNNCVTQTRKIKKDNNIIYNNFYDSEIEKSEGNQNYLKFIKILFGENNLGIPLTSVLKMEQQVTYEQFKKLWYLREKYKFSITDVLERMENWKKINGNKTVYKTFLTFIKRENPAIIIG